MKAPRRLSATPATVVAVALRPRLWPTGAAVVLRMARPGWWRRRPLVPYPDRGYWRYRVVTAYGGTGERSPDPDDVVAYLEWCRDRAALERGRRARRGL